MRTLVALSLLAAAAACNSPSPTVAEAATPVPKATPEAPEDPGYGEVAFKTFEGNSTRIVFLSPDKVRVTWRNMAGSAVLGTHTQKGREIVIEWDKSATNWGSTTEKYRQMDHCAIARYESLGKDGKSLGLSPQVYQQTKPRCQVVRVAN
jgi:hypothetical protein